MKLQKKIDENNKIKLLKLKKSRTLDKFIVVKCDSDTLLITKYNNNKYVKLHDYEAYPYALIKGQQKNIEGVMKECNLKESNKIINLELPSHQNYTKRMREILKGKFQRLTRTYKQTIVNGFQERVYLDENDIECDIECENDDDELRISVTRFFKLNDITEEEFISEVNRINNLRFN